MSSRAKLGYADAQAALDEGRADEMLRLLPEIGALLQEAERDRGGASLGVPTQEVVARDDGYTLRFRSLLPVEGWNAQLAAHRARRRRHDARGSRGHRADDAARRPVRRGPAPSRGRRPRRRLARERPYAEMLHTIDPSRSDAESVFLQEAAALFRAASYVAFDGHPPPDPMHAALAAPYAHCTAPLRRLADRYANEVCLALCTGVEVPSWAREALPALPIEMALGAERGNRLERTVVDAVEAAVLAPLVGRESDALVIDLWKRGRGGSAAACRDRALRRRARARRDGAGPARGGRRHEAHDPLLAGFPRRWFDPPASVRRKYGPHRTEGKFRWPRTPRRQAPDRAAFPADRSAARQARLALSPGPRIPDGPLAFESTLDPQPLSDLEEDGGATSAAGNTGWHFAITRNATYAPHLPNYSAPRAGARSRRRPAST